MSETEVPCAAPQSDPYVDLHLHTHNSLLDGVGLEEEYAARAKQYGRRHLCVTDHGSMTTVPLLIEACANYGLEPIVGIEAYLNDFNHLVPHYPSLDDAQKQAVKRNSHLLLLAMNTRGYKKLLRLSNEAHSRDAKSGLPEGACGFYGRPRVSWKRVAEECSSGDVICLTGCLGGQVQAALLESGLDSGREALKPYMEVFGPDRLFIEWMMINIPEQDKNLAPLFQLAEETGLPTVLTNDVHYCDKRDDMLQRVQLLMSKNGATLANPDGALEFSSSAFWMMSSRDIIARWRKHYIDTVPRDILIESILNTERIADRCSGNLEFDYSLKLPEFENAEQLLVDMTKKGLARIGKLNDPRYVTQAREELETIIEKGFASYFVIMHKVISHAIEIGAPPGPGRGSACGSLVTYALGITDIDPIEHNLLFWRFLSPNRGGSFIKLGL